jgi:hypothetical protein
MAEGRVQQLGPLADLRARAESELVRRARGELL